MKKGEKNALKWVTLTLCAVIALTVYIESQYQDAQSIKSSPTSSAKTSENQIPNQGTANRRTDVTVIPSGMNPDDLPDADSRGATLLTLYCAQCHELPTPAMHTASEWNQVLGRMRTQMQSNRGGILSRVLMPPEKDWELLKTYLKTNAQTALDSSQLADLDSPGGSAFQSTCSQCHAAPSPVSHTANEWPRVVLRMKSHILRTGKKMPDQESMMSIISYLQNHSKSG